MLKRMLKNERGLTLIELLAVVVILGIISAIAVPSIGGLIDNTKKDAHVANATQMINAAKIYVTGSAESIDDGGTEKLTLQMLYDKNLLEEMEDPDGDEYTPTSGGSDVGSYVLIERDGTKFTYNVRLTNGTRGVEGEEGAFGREDVSEDTN